MADPHPFYFLSSAFTYPEYREPRPPVTVLLSLAHDLGLTGLPPETHESFALQQLQAEYMRLAETLWAGTEPLVGVPMKDRDIFDLLGFD